MLAPLPKGYKMHLYNWRKTALYRSNSAFLFNSVNYNFMPNRVCIWLERSLTVVVYSQLREIVHQMQCLQFDNLMVYTEREIYTSLKTRQHSNEGLNSSAVCFFIPRTVYVFCQEGRYFLWLLYNKRLWASQICTKHFIDSPISLIWAFQEDHSTILRPARIRRSVLQIS